MIASRQLYCLCDTIGIYSSIRAQEQDIESKVAEHEAMVLDSLVEEVSKGILGQRIRVLGIQAWNCESAFAENLRMVGSINNGKFWFLRFIFRSESLYKAVLRLNNKVVYKVTYVSTAVLSTAAISPSPGNRLFNASISSIRLSVDERDKLKLY